MQTIYKLIIFGIILGIIGVPLSYLAMRVERKDIYLPLKSWIRIFITFVITGILAKIIESKYI